MNWYCPSSYTQISLYLEGLEVKWQKSEKYLVTQLGKKGFYPKSSFAVWMTKVQVYLWRISCDFWTVQQEQNNMTLNFRLPSLFCHWGLFFPCFSSTHFAELFLYLSEVIWNGWDPNYVALKSEQLTILIALKVW